MKDLKFNGGDCVRFLDLERIKGGLSIGALCDAMCVSRQTYWRGTFGIDCYYRGLRHLGSLEAFGLWLLRGCVFDEVVLVSKSISKGKRGRPKKEVVRGRAMRYRMKVDGKSNPVGRLRDEEG